MTTRNPATISPPTRISKVNSGS